MEPSDNINMNKDRYSEIAPSYDENMVSDKNYNIDIYKQKLFSASIPKK
jgi:hypothetical protein